MILCVGVEVATKGNASEIRATCVKIGGILDGSIYSSWSFNLGTWCKRMQTNWFGGRQDSVTV
jgi:hypothetical protein